MLYRATPEGIVPWAGEAIGDIRYPLNIETLFSADQLAALGLYSVPNPVVPDGQRAINMRIGVVDGRPAWEFDLVQMSEG